MKLLIDRRTARQAKFITSTTEYGPTRRYYEMPGGALLRLDDNLTIEHVMHRVVDARIGQDEARPGFTLDESRIGQKRVKITISRVLRDQHQLTLSEVLEAEK